MRRGSWKCVAVTPVVLVRILLVNCAHNARAQHKKFKGDCT